MTQAQFETRLKEALENTLAIEFTKAEVSAILDTIAGEIQSAFKHKETVVVVRGIGRWRLADRKARMGRNPQTGEAIKIKASRKLVVKASAPMATALKAKH